MRPGATLAAVLWLALAGAPAGCGGAPRGPAIGAPAAAPGYAIKLHRAQKAGDRGMVSTVVHSHRSMVMEDAGQVVKRDEQTEVIELKASVRVLRVDGRGSPLEIEYSIHALSVSRDEGERKNYPPGRVVVADRGEKKVTFTAAPPLTEEEEKLFSEIVSPRSSGATDDDVFGTPERQALGASWPVNAALMAKELAETGLHVTADAVSGQVRLVGLVKDGGRDCIELSGEFTVRDAWPTDIPGARPETGEVRSTYHTVLPIDASAPEVESAITVDVDLGMLISLSPDHEAKATMISRKSTRRRFTQLP